MQLYKIVSVVHTLDPTMLRVVISSGDGCDVEGLIESQQLREITRICWEKKPEDLANHYFFSVEENKWKAFLLLLKEQVLRKPENLEQIFSTLFQFHADRPLIHSGLVDESEIETLKTVLRLIFPRGQTISIQVPI